MTLSLEEFVAHGADALIRSFQLDPNKVDDATRADFVADTRTVLEAVGAYEMYLDCSARSRGIHGPKGDGTCPSPICVIIRRLEI